MYITPTHHEKMEWSRLATAAYMVGLNQTGHTFSVAASRPTGTMMSLLQYDSMMAVYRRWLNHGMIGQVAAPMPSKTFNPPAQA